MKRILYPTATALLLMMTGLTFLQSDPSTKAQKPSVAKKSQDQTPPQKALDEKPTNRKLIVYYFRQDFRCPSCKKIEAYTEEAVKSNFADQLKSGKMGFEMVNVDEKGNEHFVKDYDLYTKSVVLVDTKDGKQTRWKNLPKIWELLSDKGAFQSYICAEIKEYQKAGS